MIKVTLTNSVIGRNTYIVPETTILRDFLNEHEYEIRIGHISMGGAFLSNEELDMSFEELGVEGDTFINDIAKHDNAATVKVVGNACVIESSCDYETLKTLAKYNPDSLCLMDDKKNVKFAIAPAKKGYGDINKYGAEFADDGNGKAIVTCVIPEGTVDKTQWVEDNIGFAILNVNEVEAKAQEGMTIVNGKLAAVRSSIQVF